MKTNTLELLRCVKGTNKGSCSGMLQVNNIAMPAVYATGDSNELLEGLLQCQKCQTQYPVLAGVAIIVPQLLTHLRDNYATILQLTMDLGGIGARMRAWMSEKKIYWDRTKSSESQRYSGAARLNVYLGAHYDDLSACLPPEHPLNKILQTIYPQDLYMSLMDMAGPHLLTEGIALDVGCNVGRLALELSRRCRFVYGVDLAFGAVLAARRLLLGQPEPLKTYEFVRNGLNMETRPLEVEGRQNVDLLVASALALPFESGAFDTVSSSNLIDVTPNPRGVIQSKEKILRIGGVLLTTDPYWWNIDDAPLERWVGGYGGVESAQAMRELLTELGFEIVAEEDMVPWILRYHDRQVTLHFNHNLVARKLNKIIQRQIDHE